jgi:hypothetical protein
MFAKRFLIVVLAVLAVLLFASSCLAQEGWRTNSGTAESADYGKIAPGLYYNLLYKTYFQNQTYFSINGVVFDWSLDGKNRFSISLRDQARGVTPPKEFCTVSSLDSVNDPSKLSFTKPGQSRLVHQSVKIVNGKSVASKPSNKFQKGSSITSGVSWGGPLSASSFVGGPSLVFKIRDDLYVGLEAIAIEEKVWSGPEYFGYKSGSKHGGVMEYNWKSWTRSVWSNKLLQTARSE